MPRLVEAPSVIAATGTKPKKIDEYVGRANTATNDVSVALMSSPAGWEERGQRPDFEEITLVLTGTVRVEFEGGVIDVGAGRAVITYPGEWVRYSTPGGARYVAICRPAFSPDTVHRDP